jgi:hypothetical protein
MAAKTLLSALCLAQLALAQSAPPQDAARAARIVPLGGFPFEAPVPRQVPLPWFLGEVVPRDPASLLDLESLPRRVTVDAIVDLLYQRFGQAVEEGRLVFDADRALRLFGDAGLVEEAAQFVSAIEAAMVIPVTVEAWWYDARDGRIARDAKPVLSADEAAAAIPDAPLWHGKVRTTAGTTVGLGTWRTTPVVRRVNTEVASEMGIANPVPGTLEEGVRLAVEVHALAGSSDLVVFGQAAFAGRRGPIRTESTGLLGQPSIDVVEVDSDAATFSARVEDGGRLVIWHAGEESTGARRALIVQVRRAEAGPAPEGVEVLPVGAIVRMGLVRRATYGDADGSDASAPLLAVAGEPGEGGGCLDPDALLDLVGATLGEAWEDGAARIETVGENQVVFADADGRRRARELVARLEDSLLVNVGIVARTEAGERVLHELAFPALLGRPHLAVRGIESTGVATMRSEIAQKFAVLTPHVDHRFRGIVASLVPLAGARGIQLDAQVDLAMLEQPRIRSLEGDRGGVLSLQGRDHARLLHRGAVERGRPIDLGEGPQVDGLRSRQSLEIR